MSFSLRRFIVFPISLVFLAGCGDDSTNVTNVTSPVAVSAVFPAEARIGQTVTVHGQNFGSTQGTSTLRFNSAVATQVASWSDSQIVATVPPGASTGDVTVRVDGVDGAPGHLVVPWQAQDPDNVAISTAAEAQGAARIIADGTGGAIMVWADNRSGNADIYAQRIDSAGTALWTAGGRAIAEGSSHETIPQLIADGSGGAIIVWRDHRNGNADIYAQRVNGDGEAQWSAGGVAVTTATDRQDFLQVVADGAGGAIVVWQDYRNGPTADVYAQRIDSAGAALWTADGVAISTETNSQLDPQIAADGAGGAVMTWWDRRSGVDFDIYAQRVNGAGQAQWTAGGIAVTTAAGDQQYPRLVSDGTGGAIVAWEDGRSGGGYFDIYVQRIDSAGVPQWTADGVAVSTAADDQQTVRMIADGAGGAIIAWTDRRSGVTEGYDIYAQRVDSSGATQWTADGQAVCTATGPQWYQELVPDGIGGAILVWHDNRAELASGGYDIYAQRLNRFGVAQWTADGLAVSTAAGSQSIPHLIEDGAGGVVIVWEDKRAGGTIGTEDLYAQGITASGQ